ncbi:MAG: cyclase family protein [Pseudobdellovibrionaceae bacterium]
MKYFDITPLISEKLAVFPGDTPFSRNILMDFKKGQHLLLSSIQTTVHLGAHADSSGHYHVMGEGIEKRPLEPYLGQCQVVEVSTKKGHRILPKDLKSPIEADRVLFKTGSFPDPHHWNSDFSSLSPELIEFLAEKKVSLVGIDTPSVDPEDSKGLESHQSIFKYKMCILEGIVLDKVPAGLYTLVALPLPIENCDASPVRAILLENSQLIRSSLIPAE